MRTGSPSPPPRPRASAGMAKSCIAEPCGRPERCRAHVRSMSTVTSARRRRRRTAAVVHPQGQRAIARADPVDDDERLPLRPAERPSLGRSPCAWKRTTLQVVVDADVEIDRPGGGCRAARTRRRCSRIPSASRRADTRSSADSYSGIWKRSLAIGVDAPARRQQVGAAAAEKQHAAVSSRASVEERRRTPLVGRRRWTARARCARRCRPAAARARARPTRVASIRRSAGRRRRCRPASCSSRGMMPSYSTCADHAASPPARTARRGSRGTRCRSARGWRACQRAAGRARR